MVDQGAAQVQREELDKARTELAHLKRSMGECNGWGLRSHDLWKLFK